VPNYVWPTVGSAFFRAFLRRRIPSILFVVALALSCGKVERKRDVAAGRRVTDDLGREVDVPLEPRRIVCTSPELTEILFAVGAGDRLVGVARGCDWPVAARKLPVVGDFSNVSVERVAALEPDLIFTTGHEQERMVAQLGRLGVPTVAFLAPDVAGVRKNIMAVGSLVGEEEKAAAVVAELDNDLARVAAAVARVPRGSRPRVYLEISPSPLMTVAEGSFVHQAIVLAGGVNIGADLPRPYSRIDAEEVIARDPEVIILCHKGTAADVAARTGWSGIAAVRAGRIYNINADLVLRAGPRFGKGVGVLHRYFYAKPRREGAK